MKTIKILVGIIVVMILLFLAWAAIRPSEIAINEKVVINAPIEEVFEQINDLHNWQNWSPWKDSTYNTEYGEITIGKGAKMIWNDKKEGKGTLTIIESMTNKEIVATLVFGEKSDGTSTKFTFVDLPEGTEVTWSMEVTDLSFPLGRMVGYMIEKGAEHNFAKGLEALKTYVEEKGD